MNGKSTVKRRKKCPGGCGSTDQHHGKAECIRWLRGQVRSLTATVIGLERHARERPRPPIGRQKLLGIMPGRFTTGDASMRPRFRPAKPRPAVTS